MFLRSSQYILSPACLCVPHISRAMLGPPPVGQISSHIYISFSSHVAASSSISLENTKTIIWQFEQAAWLYQLALPLLKPIGGCMQMGL